MNLLDWRKLWGSMTFNLTKKLFPIDHGCLLHSCAIYTLWSYQNLDLSSCFFFFFLLAFFDISRTWWIQKFDKSVAIFELFWHNPITPFSLVLKSLFLLLELSSLSNEDPYTSCFFGFFQLIVSLKEILCQVF